MNVFLTQVFRNIRWAYGVHWYTGTGESGYFKILCGPFFGTIKRVISIPIERVFSCIYVACNSSKYSSTFCFQAYIFFILHIFTASLCNFKPYLIILVVRPIKFLLFLCSRHRHCHLSVSSVFSAGMRNKNYEKLEKLIISRNVVQITLICIVLHCAKKVNNN